MKIHIIAPSLFMNSGYSNVAKYLGQGLQKLGYEVTMTGMQTAYEIDNRYGIIQYPIQTSFVDETSQILINLQTTNPDLVICIFQSDDQSLNHIPHLFKKTIWYTTIEGSRVPKYSIKEFLMVMNDGGKIVVPSMFGVNEIVKEWNKMEVDYIPYGYDDKIFKPLDINNLNNDGIYKTEIVSYLKWGIRGDSKEAGWIQYNVSLNEMLHDSSMKNKYILGQVAQNFGVRKRFERLLKAYSILLGESKMLKDRTVLHLHTFPRSHLGMDLMNECERLGIQNNVTFSYGDYRSSGWSDNALCILMNSFDCHVSASSGEGYSLPCLETMACGIPNIAPRFSSFPELIGDNENDNERGLLAELDTIQMTQTTSYKALVSEKDLALKMHVMYVKKEDRERYSKNCIQFVRNRTWDKIILLWDELLKSLV